MHILGMWAFCFGNKQLKCKRKKSNTCTCTWKVVTVMMQPCTFPSESRGTSCLGVFSRSLQVYIVRRDFYVLSTLSLFPAQPQSSGHLQLPASGTHLDVDLKARFELSTNNFRWGWIWVFENEPILQRLNFYLLNFYTDMLAVEQGLLDVFFFLHFYILSFTE